MHKVLKFGRSELRLKLCFSIMLIALAYAKRGFSAEGDGWDYAPYLNGHEWPRIPVVTYVESKSNIWVHPTDSKAFPSITEQRQDAADDFTTVILRLPDGEVYKTYNDAGLGPYLCAVYSGDFNNDGKPDFLAIKPTGGNGIGVWEYIGIFAFSEGENYRFTRVNSWGISPQSLVLDPATKSFRFVHTSFRQGTGLDGRDHSFWVHRFFKWEGASFQSDDKIAPVWIQYLDRPNHAPTKLLTQKMKSKIWSEDWRFNSEVQW